MENENGANIGAPNPPLVAPFLEKCYDMVDNPSTDETISWGECNNSFVIWHEHAMESDILPKNSKRNKLASFVRQLHTYVSPFSLYPFFGLLKFIKFFFEWLMIF